MQKNTIYLAVVIAITITIAAVSFAYFAAIHSPDYVSNEDNSKRNQPPGTEGSSIGFPGAQAEITDWKIYQNNEYGFEVKYPPEYKISGDPISCFSTDGESTKGKMMAILNKNYWDGDRLYGDVRPTLGIGDFNIYVNDPKDQCSTVYSNDPGGPEVAEREPANQLVNTQSIVVNEYPVTRKNYKAHYFAGAEEVVYDYSLWQFQKDHVFVTLTYNEQYSDYDEQQNGRELFERFLSTFRFTD